MHGLHRLHGLHGSHSLATMDETWNHGTDGVRSVILPTRKAIAWTWISRRPFSAGGLLLFAAWQLNAPTGWLLIAVGCGVIASITRSVVLLTRAERAAHARHAGAAWWLEDAA